MNKDLITKVFYENSFSCYHNGELGLFFRAENADKAIKILQSELQALESEPDKELYEKVYIKSEADLPQDTGRYFCHQKSRLPEYAYDACEWYEYNITDHENRKYQRNLWLTSFDWYLMPCEPLK